MDESLLARVVEERDGLRAALAYVEHKCEQAQRGRLGALDAALLTIRQVLDGRVAVKQVDGGFVISSVARDE